MRNTVLSALALAAALLSPILLSPTAHGGEARAATVGPSGLPLPRFVSLKASQANLRIGPGTTYPVEWTYVKRGLPLEIIQEYDNWRRVRDADGTEGWVSQALLSGRHGRSDRLQRTMVPCRFLGHEGLDGTVQAVGRLSRRKSRELNAGPPAFTGNLYEKTCSCPHSALPRRALSCNRGT